MPSLIVLFIGVAIASAPFSLTAEANDETDQATRLLLVASDQGSVKAIRAALANGARINESSPRFAGADRQPPLVAAALRGHHKAVRALLELGADPLATEKDGYNAWHAASFQGRTNVLRVLTELDTPGYILHPDGFSPLHRACWGRTLRHAEAVRLLITQTQRACDEPTRSGQKPLDFTRNKKTVEILRKCLQKQKTKPSAADTGHSDSKSKRIQ